MQSTKREQIVKSKQHGVFIKWTCIKNGVMNLQNSKLCEILYQFQVISLYGIYSKLTSNEKKKLATNPDISEDIVGKNNAVYK